MVASSEIVDVELHAKEVYKRAKLTETEYRVFSILRGAKSRAKKVEAISIRMNEFRQSTEITVFISLGFQTVTG